MVMRKYTYNFTMYMGIFCGVLFGGVLPNVGGDVAAEYVSPKVDYALLDEDGSALSKGLASYLEEKHVLKEVRTFDPEVLRDDLYSRYIGGAVVLRTGFEDAFLGKDTQDYISVYDIPDNNYAIVFSSAINEYLSYVRELTDSGMSVGDAAQIAKEELSRSVEVSFLDDGSGATGYSKAYYFYLYMPWILVLMIVVALTPVLVRLDEERIRKRIYASPYKFTKMNGEIYLAMIVVGIAVCTVLFILSKMLLPGYDNTGLYVMNMLSMMLVALSITFFFSKFVKSDMVISLVGNLVSLGMAFLSGVFVPQSVMSESILSVAHFLPAYWYVRAAEAINSYKPGNLSSVLVPIGIEVLFAVALFGAGLYAAKVKRVKN